jgi:hypothetical protein
MRLGFVTTPDTVVFALHFSTGNRDCQLRRGNPGRKARPLLLAEVLNCVASYKEKEEDAVSIRGMTCIPRGLFVVRPQQCDQFGHTGPRICMRERIQSLSSNEARLSMCCQLLVICYGFDTPQSAVSLPFSTVYEWHLCCTLLLGCRPCELKTS